MLPLRDPDSTRVRGVPVFPTHRLAQLLTRRGALLALAVIVGAGRWRQARAQLGGQGCGQLGHACTLAFGCCSGLTCVTSQLNPSYGVCVTGPGGMLATTTGVIAPSEELAQQLAGTLAAQPTTPITDPQAERETRLAERQARKDAKQSRQRSRRTTRKNNRQSRRNGDNRRPDLQLLFLDPTAKRPETVRVRNDDKASVVLTDIESTDQPGIFRSLAITLAAGETYLLSSGVTEDTLDPDPDEEEVWTEKVVCRTDTDGITLSARLASGTTRFTYAADCTDQSESG